MRQEPNLSIKSPPNPKKQQTQAPPPIPESAIEFSKAAQKKPPLDVVRLLTDSKFSHNN